MISCSALGALTFGGDIDSKQLRGKGSFFSLHFSSSKKILIFDFLFKTIETNVASNAEQYNLTHKILDCAIFDMLQHPFRTGEIFDAIITDRKFFSLLFSKFTKLTC